MMTEKLFWQNPYQAEFVARILDQFQAPDGNAVVLDQTCFYATSGGQPNDLGTLNSVLLKDVRFDENRLLHITTKPLEGIEAHGIVDWKRRFDHMQQHTGQHILSAAFYRLFQAETSSFHLGEDYCSIELNRPDLTADQISQAEEHSNAVIFGAISIDAFLIDPEKAADYSLRKQSDLKEALRIIRIGDFDQSPCSGTHVRNSGEVGMAFITGTEKLSQTLKVSFLCGARIAKRYHLDLDILKSLSRSMTTSFEQLPDSLSKLLEQVKDTRKELARVTEEQLKSEAGQLAAQAVRENEMLPVVHVWKRPYSEVRFIAQKLSEVPGLFGGLASTSDRRAVFFKNRELALDIRPVFQRFLSEHSAKGGGPPHLMEAGGFTIANDFESKFLDLFR